MRNGPPARAPELPCRAIAAAIRAQNWRCDDACMLSAFATELTLNYPFTEYGGAPTLPFPDFASPCSWTAVSGTHAPITAGHPGRTPVLARQASHATMPVTWTLIADSLNWAGSCCGYREHEDPPEAAAKVAALVASRRPEATTHAYPHNRPGSGQEMPEVTVPGQQMGS